MSDEGSSGVDPGAIILSIITVIVILVLAWVVNSELNHDPTSGHSPATEQPDEAPTDH